MAYKEHEIKKKYFTISDVAKEFGVATSLLRFWEKEFSILKPKKNAKGYRQYTVEDVKSVRLVYYLVKKRGLTLQGARDYLEELTEGLVAVEFSGGRKDLVDVKTIRIGNDSYHYIPYWFKETEGKPVTILTFDSLPESVKHEIIKMRL